MKRVTLLAVGSRGDVEPCIALALGLRAAGWTPRVAALAPFREVVEGHELAFVSLGELPSRFRTASPRTPSHAGVGGRALFWAVYQRLLAGYLPQFIEACEGAELIVHTGLAFAAYHVAEAMGVPCAALAFVPGVATSAFVNPLFVRRRLSVHPTWNRATFTVEQQLMVQTTGHVINSWRSSSLGLRPVPRRDLLEHRWAHTHAMLIGVSPHLVARPADWDARVHMVGPLLLTQAQSDAPEPALQTFVEGGTPPIYVGFGSMTHGDGARFTRATLTALRRVGRRGVLATGWGGLAPGDELGPDVHVVESVSHRWLFPRVAAAVHHAGAGTTTAALLAGCPAVLVPIDYDQRFWARRLADLRASPEPIEPAKLSGRSLAAALHAVLEPRYRARVAKLRDGLREEDGVAACVEILERLFIDHA
ncbi:UDP-glucose:sterol glucosyltransferase [Enhygromyxa salina]|uniref:UDP-glucose:sterol glucosyltransferase n=1 Tax=Enhygromyxa salina TaxID=215803 RepID=A0A0C2A3B6_9BACT|nr:glycosyltransferase [Enhygromyxa salina]KIG17873.1 UDP-glucose:sterol glucosyltransferase [Enhygromyxa salina]